MAKFTVEVPDQEMAGLEEAFCSAYNYAPTVPDPKWTATVKDADGAEISNPEPQAQVPNPTSPTAFTISQVVRFMHEVYLAHKSNQAQAAAQAQVAELAPPSVSITTS